MRDMSDRLYPLCFVPVYKSYLWGGQRIATRFHRAGAPSVCAESWELSAHPDGMSVATNGPLAGLSLEALTQRFGAALIGSRAPNPHRFPLLMKLIDARQNLSVQVHPSDATAERVRGEAKTEMWMVLDREPGSALYAGLKPGTTADSFRKSLSDGKAADCLLRLDAHPGDALFIPGGTVHAIGAGNLIYEVQQTSNTTYRLFDWGRLDAQGNPRPLQIEEGFLVIDFSLPAPRMIHPQTPPADGRNHRSRILACRYFDLHRSTLRQAATIPLGGSTFHALFIESGSVAVSANDVTVLLDAGGSCLIPAEADAFFLHPLESAGTTILTTTLPVP